MGLPSTATQDAAKRTPSSSLLRLSLLAIILLAFLLRTWDLDRLPPGLYFDEAYNAIDAKNVVDGSARPVFFAGNYGREPAFIYLQAFALMLWGSSAYSLRLVAAFAGILTVPAIWLLAQAVIGWHQAQRKIAPTVWVALVAAAGLAASYWHLSLSRLGFRVILLPLFSALAVYFFIKAWRGQRRLHFALAGFWLGAAQYTYISSRLLLVVIGGFIALEIAHSFWSRTRRAQASSAPATARQYIASVGVIIAVGLLTVAPLLWTFTLHPEYVFSRVGDVSIFVPASKVAPGTPMQRLGENLVNVTTSFFFTGDLNPRHNLPGRSLNDPVLATLFAVGFFTSLVMLRKPVHRLVLLWLTVMLTPTIFSLQSPHWLRMAGAVPATAILYAIGAQTFAVLLERWLAPVRTTILILLTVLVVSVPATVSAYFGQWAQLPTLAKSFDADQYEAAIGVRSLLAEEKTQPILLTRRLFRSIHMRLLNPQLPDAAPSLAGTDEWLAVAAGARYLIEDDADIGQPLFLLEQRPDGDLAVTQLSPYNAQGESLIADILDGKAPFDLRSARPENEKPLLSTGELPTMSFKLDRVQYPLRVRFVNGVELVGYSLPEGVVPCDSAGDDLPLILHFRRESGESFYDNGVLLFAHLMLPEQQLQDNGHIVETFPLALWQAGDIIDTQRNFSLPDSLPPGKAFFEAGLFWLAPDGSIERAGIVDGEGRIGGDQVIFGPLEICDGVADVSFDGLSAVEADFEGRIALDGARIQQAQDAPGTLQVDLGWRAIDRSPTGYTAFVHLLDTADNIVAQHDFPVGGADNPTNLWVPGEKVRSTAVLTLPPDYDPTRHRLRIGLYEPVSGRQLAVTMPEQMRAATYILLDVTE